MSPCMVDRLNEERHRRFVGRVAERDLFRPVLASEEPPFNVRWIERPGSIPRYSDETIAATIAYCEHVYWRYGRFPANNIPFRTVPAHQTHHLDPDFYHPETLTAVQRQYPHTSPETH